MAHITSLKCLPTIVRHKIGELKRIKRELKLAEHIPAIDNFSLLILYSPYALDKLIDSISLSMRSSDLIALTDRFLICLLPGTDKEGAIHLAEGVKDFLGEEGYYIVATYPEDGESYEELREALATYASSRNVPIPDL